MSRASHQLLSLEELLLTWALTLLSSRSHFFFPWSLFSLTISPCEDQLMFVVSQDLLKH